MGVNVMMDLCFDPNLVLLYGKRRLRRLFWRVRAEIRRQIKSRSNKLHKKRFNFNYDHFSYSLNFDNGNFGFFC
ncbi:hypothetical protein L484_023083 [Morus notabilis]|uniref:Uncharacterized protein n=1 Tax=Morus notabilis TaxID=981085 RepID=W9SAP7_9ROSA|nr:hypothetical protein L484_023083 [Morus notabilis]